MKPMVGLSSNPTSNTPFKPGVWLNSSEVEKVIQYLPEDSWLRADLIEKFEVAKADAARQTAAYCAGADVKVIDVQLWKEVK